MRTYKLIANNEQGASVEFTGNSMANVKNQFNSAYEQKDFIARLYDNCNGALVQLKAIGKKTFKNPSNR